MVQIIPDDRRDVFGKIGKGLAQGLGEQVPKEIERYRLSEGLKNLESQGNLSPFQQFSRLASIPGVTPQMIQSGSELLRQQAKGQALQNQPPKPSPFPQQPSKPPGQAQGTPSLTTEETSAKAQEGYIPPTQDEIFAEAGRRYNENPALFGNDPNKAIAAAEEAAQRDQARAEAYQRKHENLDRIQTNVVNRLQKHSTGLGVKIPANVYSKIEDKAIQATKPKSQGGEGLTEQQAMKKYGEELDELSRDYQSIDTIGNWAITGRKAKDTLSNIKSLQEKFAKRGDTENFADSLIAKNKLSPMVAYSLAEPVSKVPALNSAINKLPKIANRFTKNIDAETLKIAPKLVEAMGTEGSPLAIAYELEKLGYSPSAWMQYLTDHRDDLNLLKSKDRQLDKPRNIIGTLNDWWLSSWSGLDKTKGE